MIGEKLGDRQTVFIVPLHSQLERFQAAYQQVHVVRRIDRAHDAPQIADRFELRMQRHNENGLAVAQFLANHPRVEKVYYPGLETHPYYGVARRQMRGFGGLVTFLVKDADWRTTANIVDATRLARIAPPWGC